MSRAMPPCGAKLTSRDCDCVKDGKGSQMQFEGVMADRRIGGTDRESYAIVSFFDRLQQLRRVVKFVYQQCQD